MNDEALEAWRRQLAVRLGVDYDAVMAKPCKDCSRPEQRVKYGKPKSAKEKAAKVRARKMPQHIKDMEHVCNTELQEGEPARYAFLRRMKEKNPWKFLDTLTEAKVKFAGEASAASAVSSSEPDAGTEKAIAMCEEFLKGLAKG